MVTKLTELQQLALDTYKGQVKVYSQVDAENAIKKAINEACGGEWNFYSFQQNKWKVFQIISEVLSVSTGTLLADKFKEFIDVKDTNLGQQLEFTVKNSDLFRVASIANGNYDIRRQKVFNSKLTVQTEKLAIKIYSDIEDLMTGVIDWQEMVNRVMLSFANEIGVRIYNAIYGSFDSLVAPYAYSGTFNEDKLQEMIANVEAGTGQKAIIYGTKKALSKIQNADKTLISEDMKNQINLTGHYGQYQGTPLMELPQAHVAGDKSKLVVADDFLLVIPQDEKIVKVALEGDAEAYDTPVGTRNDGQVEFYFGRRVGVAVLLAYIYGIYKIG